MKKTNKMNEMQLKNEVKGNSNSNEDTDMYPTDENIEVKNAESSYYTPFGD